MLTKEILSTPSYIARPDQLLSEITDYLVRDKFLIVMSEGAYKGMITPCDALIGSGLTVGDHLLPTPICYETDLLLDTIEVLMVHKLVAVPVFDVGTALFSGVVTITDFLSAMRDGRLGMAKVTINNRVGPLDFEDAKADFLEEVCGDLKTPLQRISSLSNLIKREENDKTRMLYCASIDAAVDQIDKSFDALRKVSFHRSRVNTA